jgi:hypothetical protein
VRNVGSQPTGGFGVRLGEGDNTLHTWNVPGLSPLHGGNDSADVSFLWSPVASGDRQLAFVADSNDQVAEPCDSNNVMQYTVDLPPYTDLAVRAASATPAAPTSSTTTIRLAAEIVNRGGLGAPDNQIVVKFWDGTPEAGGRLLRTATLSRAAGQVATVAHDWVDFSPGVHEVVIEVLPATGETRLDNNRQSVTVIVPSGDNYLFMPRIRL